MKYDAGSGKYVANDGSNIDVDERISVYIRPDGSKLDIDPPTKVFYGRDGSSYDVPSGQLFQY